MLISTAYLSLDEAERLRSKGYDLEIDADNEVAKITKSSSETSQEGLQ